MTSRHPADILYLSRLPVSGCVFSIYPGSGLPPGVRQRDAPMRIVLVFPPFYLSTMYNLPPLGLINLATALKDSPHQVILMDFVLALRQERLAMGKEIYRDCARQIMEASPDLVAFSTQCTTYPAVIQISHKIKASNPGVKIVIGGHNASFLDQITLKRYPFVDAVVRGEGEITFQELVAAYAAGRDSGGIDGVTYRHGAEIIRNKDRDLISSLDDLSLPDYGFAPPFEEYRAACELPRSIAILDVGRGCPHRCIYCSESILWRRRCRTFSVARLVEEMKNLHTHFGAECFLLAYDQFTASRTFVEAFCTRVIKEGLNTLPWYCISRLDSVDAPLLALMREAGCESMCYGIDSGSKRTLSFIRKNIDHQILYQRVVETADQGIIPTLSFVIGFPEEERSDIDETLAMALRTGIVGNNNPLIQMPTVLPGTDLHSRYGSRLVREVDTYFALGLEFDGGKRLKADEALIDSDPLIYSSFYNLPCPGRSLTELKLLATHFPLMVQLYPKSFLLLSLERGEPVSDLFLHWLRWLQDRLHREEPDQSPQDCYLYFTEFAFFLLGGDGELARPYLPDILRYEKAALETGRFSSGESNFHIDLHRIQDLRPAAREGMIIESFDFPVPAIIGDLKAGRFNRYYGAQKSLLLFRHDHDLLDVREINPFTRDFLELCNGERDIQAICRVLYPRYGEDRDYEAFLRSCTQALEVLAESRLIGPGQIQDPEGMRNQGSR